MAVKETTEYDNFLNKKVETPQENKLFDDTEVTAQKEADKFWVNMPEFVQEDLTPFRVINVRFRNEEDVQEFARLMQQEITPKQKALWFPFAEFRRASHLRWVDES